METPESTPEDVTPEETQEDEERTGPAYDPRQAEGDDPEADV
jgi:hypothetical protein